MLFDPGKIRIFYVACGFTDMRKQIDGLSAIVRIQYEKEFDEETLFLFCGRKADRIKALYWDGTGYLLLYKRLVNQRFQWPRNESELKQVTQQEYRWLMEGLSIYQKRVIKETEPGRMF